MTPPPTSIDGTDITGATIDGQDVQSISIDGQEVFTAGPSVNDIVAPGNLRVWYPFENRNNNTGIALDETRTGGVLDANGIAVGDSTDFSTPNNGATFLASGGVSDLGVGENSGAYDFDGVDDVINPPDGSLLFMRNTSFTINFYIKTTATNEQFIFEPRNAIAMRIAILSSNQVEFNVNQTGIMFLGNQSDGQFHMITCLLDQANNEIRGFVDGVQQGTVAGSSVNPTGDNVNAIGKQAGFSREFDGIIEDFRVYDKALTSAEITQIFDNTKP
jgi:hypothetical protein